MAAVIGFWSVDFERCRDATYLQNKQTLQIIMVAITELLTYCWQTRLKFAPRGYISD